MKLSKIQTDALNDVNKRSNGWPVGIPIDKELAFFLVNNGLAEWAPTAFIYSKPVFSVRLTAWGKAHLK